MCASLFAAVHRLNTLVSPFMLPEDACRLTLVSKKGNIDSPIDFIVTKKCAGHCTLQWGSSSSEPVSVDTLCEEHGIYWAVQLSPPAVLA